MATFYQRLKYLFTGKPDGRSTVTSPMSKIDAAQNTPENRKHWSAADSLGPNAAYDPVTRQRLRDRARFESINNSYARGLIRTLPNDLLGSCPRLQLLIPSKTGADHSPVAKAIERLFVAWSRQVKLGRKMRLMERQSVRDGGAFAILFDNPAYDTASEDEDPRVTLDLRVMEPEQCASPPSLVGDPSMFDGVRLDEWGNPVEYWFLRRHPGDDTQMSGMSDRDFVRYTADRVLHWREVDRSGAVHGIPKITASLPLFSQLRRYTLATLTAAEIASMLAGILKTTLPPGTEAVGMPTDWHMVELVRGALMSLPQGWEATQFRPEQPTTTYGDFKREILNECGRGTGAPLNVVSGNSSGYNFSSAKCDRNLYEDGLRIDRYDFADDVLNPLFVAWVGAAKAAGLIAGELPAVSTWRVTWHFDGFSPLDQNKDATADDTRIKNGTSTYAEVYGAYGQQWDEQFEQMAVEKAKAEELGLPWPILSPVAAAPMTPADAADPALDDTADDEPIDDAEGDTPPSDAKVWERFKPAINGHAKAVSRG